MKIHTSGTGKGQRIFRSTSKNPAGFSSGKALFPSTARIAGNSLTIKRSYSGSGPGSVRMDKGPGKGTFKPSAGGKNPGKEKSSLWSPWKIMGFSVIIGLAGSLYLTHVFQTQQALREVQQLRSKYEKAYRIHSDTRKDFEHMTGPAEIYRRAASMGMVTGGAVDPVLEWNDGP